MAQEIGNGGYFYAILTLFFGTFVWDLTNAYNEAGHLFNHYENQTEDEAVAEDEAAWEDPSHTFVEVPNELVPAVRELIAKKVA
jgi:hypothetical protein